MPRHHVAFELANAVLAGPNGPQEFAARLASALGHKHRWVAPLAQRIFGRFGSGLVHWMRSELVEFIEADSRFQNAWSGRTPPHIQHYFLRSPRMEPRKGALAACALPALSTPGDLARTSAGCSPNFNL
jgi:hypothetical protein